MKFTAPANARSISKETDVYPVVDGVVDLPHSLGIELGLEAAPDASDAPKAKKSEGKK